MPVDFLSDGQASAYARFAGAPSQTELERFVFLDDADRSVVEKCRGDANRLGFGVQLGPDYAIDVTQDVFVALWSDPEKFDPARGSLRSFLLVLAHKAVNVVRSETARLAREQRNDAEATPTSAKAEDRLLGDEVATRVRSALADLPVNEREAIVSSFYEHRSYRATARWLGEPEGTIKSRIRSGLKGLRPLLTESR